MNSSIFKSPSWLILAIVLLACNLRAPITSIGPVIQNIGVSFKLSGSALGLLTSLPLLAFALVSPFAPVISRKFGIIQALIFSMLMIMGGLLLRYLPQATCLYLGTALIGAGIAIGNVLLPSLIKQRFPEHIALLTSIYAFTMGVAAAAASALVIPMMKQLNDSWSLALLVFIIMPIITFLVWLPLHQHQNHAVPTVQTATPAPAKPIWKHLLAWQVTLFMGINSLIYYSIITWLPSILQDAGFSATQAGSIHGLLQLFSALPGFVIVPLMAKFNDQRLPSSLVCVCMIIGLIGINWYAAWAWVWAALIGFGSGGAVLLGLMFMGLRTHTSARAASLSGLAQCVGYVLAAIAPPLLGLLQGQQNHWQGVLSVLTAAAVLVFINGLWAGRAVKI